MSYSHYERLTALDAMFLGLEDEHVSMHVGAIGIFSHGTLANEAGQVDFEQVRAFTETALDAVPRFRQKLAMVPLFDHPVWIDDDRFNLNYHLRHSALPAPGSVRQLKRMVGRLMSQKLDRGKPMWEMAVVDGLEGGHFALVFKAHHCMVDGIAGMDLIATLLRLGPTAASPAPHRWVPRPAPDALRLLRDEVSHRASEPFSLIAATPAALAHPLRVFDRVREQAGAAIEVLSAGLVPSVATPLNDDIGQHRRTDWLQMDLGEIKRIGKAHGATINDVVLTIVAGAVGRFLRGRGMDIDADTLFRALVPVSVRRAAEKGRPGNRVVNYSAALPIHDLSPLDRLAKVVATMHEMKSSRMVQGTELLEEISDLTFSGVLVQFARLAATQRAYNVVVTNVPGPPFPLYFLGARLEEIFPVVPLFEKQALGIALFSYCGQLCWGFNADWEAVPDLHDFVDLIASELGFLSATLATASPAKRPHAQKIQSVKKRRSA